MLRGGFLSAKECTALQAVMRHPSEMHGVARRANAILLLDDGLSCADVAEVLYLDDDRVRTWFKRYQAGSLDEMTVFDWKGRSCDLSRERMAKLSARLGERLMRDSGEVAAYIAAPIAIDAPHRLDGHRRPHGLGEIGQLEEPGTALGPA